MLVFLQDTPAFVLVARAMERGPRRPDEFIGKTTAEHDGIANLF